MPAPATILLAVFVALAIGVAGTLYLLRVQRRRFAARAGIRALAAMRWREFSQFVITALQAQGFEAAPLGDGGSSRDPSDLLLRRDNRSWLLTCRQSPEYRVTGKQVEEMQKAVRLRGAAGGVIATLGQVDRAGAAASDRIELIDGRALWELIGPMLPAGLHEHIGEQARQRARKGVAAVWVVAIAAGLAVAFGAGLVRDEAPSVTRTPQAARPAPAPLPDSPAVARPSATPPVAPDETAARQQVLDGVNAVPGIDRAVWSSRSTLLVLLDTESSDPRKGICAVLERHEALRASRIQLQPPSGSKAPVRFAQCRLY